jgi:hypothetical protein
VEARNFGLTILKVDYRMKYSLIILSSLVGLSLGITSGSLALPQMPHNMTPEPPISTEQQFQRIEQPLWTKLVVAGVGMGLIGLELWWFVLSQPTAQQSKATSRWAVPTNLNQEKSHERKTSRTHPNA